MCGCRRKLSAYRIEVDRQKAEAAEQAAAEKAAAEEVAAAEAAAAETAAAAAAEPGAEDAEAGLVTLYDEFGQRQTSRFQQVPAEYLAHDVDNVLASPCLQNCTCDVERKAALPYVQPLMRFCCCIRSRDPGPPASGTGQSRAGDRI